MGLDTIELVMEFEEAFDINIPDGDAEKLHSIGDVHRYILDRWDLPELPGRCASAEVFYRLRRTIMRELRIERRMIRPASALVDLFPGPDHRAHWANLSEWLGWRLPRLERPPGVVIFASLIVVVATIAALGTGPLLLGLVREALPLSLVCGFASLLLATGLAVWATRPLAVCFPSGCTTVRGLIDAVTTMNYVSLARRRGGWESEGVMKVLIKIVSEQMGIPPEQLGPETRFTDLE